MSGRVPISGPRYSKEEFAERGDALYLQHVSPRIERAYRGQFIAIDIETGDFEVDADEMKATDRLLQRVPDAQIWFRRIGSPVARRFGPRPRKTRS